MSFLKYSRTIHHTKECCQRFEKSIISIEDSTSLISRLYVNIVEFLVYTQFGKILDFLKLEYKFGY